MISDANLLHSLRLRGKVFSGRGDGTRFVELQWVKEQIREKLGFTPHLGTLNIRLIPDDVKLRKSLADEEGTEILTAPGFCQGKLFKACLMGKMECAVVVPEVVDYPEDVVEVISSWNLRKRLHLADGDLVELTVTL